MSLALWIISACLVYVAAVAIRLWPRRNLRHYGVDSWFHLHSARIIRRTQHLPRHVPEYIIEGRWDYPPLFPALLALIPTRTLEELERFVAPLIDGLLAVMALLATAWLTQSIGLGLVAGALVSINPLCIQQSITLTPRPLSAVLLTVALAGSAAHHTWPSGAWLGLAAVSGAMVLLCHRMSAQMLVFMSIVFALTLGSPGLLVVPVASIILAWALSRGFYWQVFRGHLGELAFWRAHLPPQGSEHPLRLLGFGGPPARSPKGRVPRALRDLWLPFVLTPAILPALLFPVASAGQWPVLMKEAWIWCVSGIALCVLTTNVRQLRFIGEGHRYLVWTAFPSGVLAAAALSYAETRPLIIAACLPCLPLAFWVMKSHASCPERERALMADLKHVAHRLWQCQAPRVLCLPLDLSSAIAYLAQVPVLRHGGQGALMDIWRAVEKPAETLIADHQLTHVVCDRSVIPVEMLHLPRLQSLYVGCRLELADLSETVQNRETRFVSQLTPESASG